MNIKPILFNGPMVRAILREIELPGTGKTQTRRIIKPQPLEYKARSIDITKPVFDEEEGGWGQTQTVWRWHGGDPVEPEREIWRPLRLPYSPGDLLWVREAWRVSARHNATPPSDMKPRSMTVFFEAGGSIANQESDDDWRAVEWPGSPAYRPKWAGRLRRSLYMPRWASRLTLELTDVRVERLQEITEEDALAEGIFRQDPTPEEIASGECTTEDFVFIAPGTRSRVPPHREEWGPTAVFAFRCLWNGINEKRGFGWDANPWVGVYSFAVHHQNVDALVEARAA